MEISNDQREQLIEKIKKSSKFVTQLDESTDVSKLVQLLAYVRYSYNNSVHEDLLLCQSLDGHNKQVRLFFRRWKVFFFKVGLQWNNCIGVCTHRAAAMIS